MIVKAGSNLKDITTEKSYTGNTKIAYVCLYIYVHKWSMSGIPQLDNPGKPTLFNEL